MDDKHFEQLVDWIANSVDIEAGIPVIFDDAYQERLEKELKEK